MSYNDSTNVYSPTEYIYDPNDLTVYATLQTAIDAANSAGGGLVVIRGTAITITESLTLYDKIRIKVSDVDSFTGNLVTLVGRHHLPGSGNVAFERINLQSATDCVYYGSSCTTTVTFSECNFDLTNGYILFADDGFGALEILGCTDTSTASGIVSNSSNAGAIYINNSQNIGTSKTTNINSGEVEIRNSFIDAPINFNGSTVVELSGSRVDSTLKFNNSANGKIIDSFLNTGVDSAINHVSTGTVTLNNLTITSTHASAVIAGTGTYEIGQIDYTDNAFLHSTATFNFMRATDRDTPYIVGPNSQFTTIAEVRALGGTKIKLMGNVTENVTCVDGLSITGVPYYSSITGTNVPPLTGTSYFTNIQFLNTTHFFNSAAAGTGVLNCQNCRFKLNAAGPAAILNVPSWIGAVHIFHDCRDNSVGAVTTAFNLSSTSFIEILNSFLGTGESSASTCGGAFIKNSQIDNDLSITANSCEFANFELFGNLSLTACDSSTYQSAIYGTVTTSGAGDHDFVQSIAEGGATSSVTHNGTGTFTAHDNFFNTTNDTRLAGTGTYVLGTNSYPAAVSSPVVESLIGTYNTPGDDATDAAQIWDLTTSNTGRLMWREGTGAATVLRNLLKFNKATDTFEIGVGGTSLIKYTKVYCGSGAGSFISLNTATGETVRVADGKVGINLAPINTLDVEIPSGTTTRFTGQITREATADSTNFEIGEVFVGEATVLRAGMKCLNSWDGASLDVDLALFATDGGVATYEVMRLLKSKRVGINTTAPDRAFEINDASGNCLRLTHNDADGSATNYADLTVNNSGDLTINPSGNNTTFKNNVDSTSAYNFTDSANSTILNIDSSNKYIGINALTPTNHLTITSSGGGTTNTIGGVAFRITSLNNISSSRGSFCSYTTNDYLNVAGSDAHFLSLFPFDDSTSSNDKSWKAFKLMTEASLIDKFWINKYGSGYFAGVTGFNTTAPDKQVEINSATGDCLRLTYNDSNGSATNYADMTVNSTGDLTITPSSGNRLMPTQPGFLAYRNATIPNVTGNGTSVDPVIMNTEVFDQNSDFSTITGFFTAPVTGRYLFSFYIVLDDLAGAHTTGSMQVKTSNTNYTLFDCNYGALANANGTTITGGTVYCDMDAADTANPEIVVSNGAKVIEIVALGKRTFFSGYLVH